MTHFSPMTAIRAALRPVPISTFAPQGGAVAASPRAATVTPISTRRLDAPHGVGPCVGQETPPQVTLPRPAGATIEKPEDALAYIAVLLLLHLHGDVQEAQRIIRLADTAGLGGVA